MNNLVANIDKFICRHLYGDLLRLRELEDLRLKSYVNRSGRIPLVVEKTIIRFTGKVARGAVFFRNQDCCNNWISDICSDDSSSSGKCGLRDKYAKAVRVDDQVHLTNTGARGCSVSIPVELLLAMKPHD